MKKMPKKIPAGYTLRIELWPDKFEQITLPATATKPERKKWFHKVKKFSLVKSKPLELWKWKTEYQLLCELGREIKNVTSKK